MESKIRERTETKRESMPLNNGEQVNVNVGAPYYQELTLTGTFNEIGHAYRVLMELARQPKPTNKEAFLDLDLGIVLIPRVFQITRIEPVHDECLRVELLRLSQ